MDESGVEMEGAEKLPHGSGDNVKEPHIKSLDSKSESNGALASEAEPAAVGDANTSENGSKDLNESTDSAKQETTMNSEVEDQFNPKSEVGESMNAEGSFGEQINNKSEKVEEINTKSEAEEQTGAKTMVEKQTDPKIELVEHNPTIGGVQEEKSTDNSVDSGNLVKNALEEEASTDIADKIANEIERKGGDCVEDSAHEKNNMEIDDVVNEPAENGQVPNDMPDIKAPQSQIAALDEISQAKDEEMEDAVNMNEGEAKDELKEQGKEVFPVSSVNNQNARIVGTPAKHETDDSSRPNQCEVATPDSLVRHPPSAGGDYSGQTTKNVFTQMAEGDDGTPEEQAAFMKQLESFYRERAMDFKSPKFYGQPLNCLKLWSAVIRLGGYDTVTVSKLWRQVGESFHPPKTCTTVSWTFRIFYEKSLLEFERHKRQSGELQLPIAMVAEVSGVENEVNDGHGSASLPGRARRDAASRAMQGWHAQQLYGNCEDKNPNSMVKREKNLKSIGSIKQKRPNEVENSVKTARTESFKQLVISVVDVGPPADWVKVNVRRINDCFEVYALVPGLLREEVRVQSDPAGRLVITGEPEQVDNPWGITPFKKVVSLPARIDAHQTSAVVSLHGRLFVRVPLEQPNI